MTLRSYLDAGSSSEDRPRRSMSASLSSSSSSQSSRGSGSSASSSLLDEHEVALLSPSHRRHSLHSSLSRMQTIKEARTLPSLVIPDPVSLEDGFDVFGESLSNLDAWEETDHFGRSPRRQRRSKQSKGSPVKSPRVNKDKLKGGMKGVMPVDL